MSKNIDRRRFNKLLAGGVIGTVGATGSTQGKTDDSSIDAKLQNNEGALNPELPKEPQEYLNKIGVGDEKIWEVSEPGIGGYPAGQKINEFQQSLYVPEVRLGENYTGQVSGELEERTRTPQKFGVVFGVPFEAQTDQFQINIDVDLSWDINTGNPTWETFTEDEDLFEAPEIEPSHSEAQATSNNQVAASGATVNQTGGISVALGTASLLLAMEEEVDGSKAHAGVSAGFFIQDLTSETLLTTGYTDRANFDIASEFVNGANKSSEGSADRTAPITIEDLETGHTYRLGLAVGGSLRRADPRWYGYSNMEFEANFKQVKIQGERY